MGRVPLPMSDYVTDTRSTLDNSVRILQAILDVAADAGLLFTLLAAARLIQGLTQVSTPPPTPLGRIYFTSLKTISWHAALPMWRSDPSRSHILAPRALGHGKVTLIHDESAGSCRAPPQLPGDAQQPLGRDRAPCLTR